MFKKSVIFVLLMVFGFVLTPANLSSSAFEEKVKCPVSGEEIAKSEAKGSTEYKGTTYYFCCENCKEAFLKDPERYLNSEPGAHHDHAMMAGHHAEDTVKDPVCGMEVKKEQAEATYEYKGKTYYFCTERCKATFVENPDSYIAAEGDRVICPVMGNEVKDLESAPSYAYKGKTYYFCCPGCKDRFIADSEKYINKK